MFNDTSLLGIQSNYELPPPADPGARQIEDFLGHFSNPEYEQQNHDFLRISIPQISPRASRSGSPDFLEFDRMFEPPSSAYIY